MDNDDDEDETCPLCMNQFDETDLSFFACPCNYQVCLFCVHYIIEQMNGKCPACRQDYAESAFRYDASCAQKYRERQAGKKKGAQQRREERTREEQEKDMRAKHAEALKQRKGKAGGRKDLSEVRVVQRNVVHVIGLTANLAKLDILKRPEFFGQYGKLVRVTIGKVPTQVKVPGTSTTVPLYSAYLTFDKEDDAHVAIQAVDGFAVDGHTLRASHGTTKYCRKFLDGQPCDRKDCNFLHKLMDDIELQQGRGHEKGGQEKGHDKGGQKGSHERGGHEKGNHEKGGGKGRSEKGQGKEGKEKASAAAPAKAVAKRASAAAPSPPPPVPEVPVPVAPPKAPTPEPVTVPAVEEEEPQELPGRATSHSSSTWGGAAPAAPEPDHWEDLADEEPHGPPAAPSAPPTVAPDAFASFSGPRDIPPPKAAPVSAPTATSRTQLSVDTADRTQLGPANLPATPVGLAPVPLGPPAAAPGPPPPRPPGPSPTLAAPAPKVPGQLPVGPPPQGPPPATPKQMLVPPVAPPPQGVAAEVPLRVKASPVGFAASKSFGPPRLDAVLEPPSQPPTQPPMLHPQTPTKPPTAPPTQPPSPAAKQQPAPVGQVRGPPPAAPPVPVPLGGPPVGPPPGPPAKGPPPAPGAPPRAPPDLSLTPVPEDDALLQPAGVVQDSAPRTTPAMLASPKGEAADNAGRPYPTGQVAPGQGTTPKGPPFVTPQTPPGDQVGKHPGAPPSGPPQVPPSLPPSFPPSSFAPLVPGPEAAAAASATRPAGLSDIFEERQAHGIFSRGAFGVDSLEQAEPRLSKPTSQPPLPDGFASRPPALSSQEALQGILGGLNLGKPPPGALAGYPPRPSASGFLRSPNPLSTAPPQAAPPTMAPQYSPQQRPRDSPPVPGHVGTVLEQLLAQAQGKGGRQPDPSTAAFLAAAGLTAQAEFEEESLHNRWARAQSSQATPAALAAAAAAAAGQNDPAHLAAVQAFLRRAGEATMDRQKQQAQAQVQAQAQAQAQAQQQKQQSFDATRAGTGFGNHLGYPVKIDEDKPKMPAGGTTANILEHLLMANAGKGGRGPADPALHAGLTAQMKEALAASAASDAQVTAQWLARAQAVQAAAGGPPLSEAQLRRPGALTPADEAMAAWRIHELLADRLQHSSNFDATRAGGGYLGQHLPHHYEGYEEGYQQRAAAAATAQAHALYAAHEAAAAAGLSRHPYASLGASQWSAAAAALTGGLPWLGSQEAYAAAAGNQQQLLSGGLGAVATAKQEAARRAGGGGKGRKG